MMKSSTNPVSRGADDHPASSAFTLTELLVVIAVLALLAATQLPALSRAKAPVKFTQCMNNLRQMGQATLLYLPDNNDSYPYAYRTSIESYGWPILLLRYLGGYRTNVQPRVFICPSAQDTPVAGGAFQLNYQANGMLFGDSHDSDIQRRGSQVRKPAIYWMLMDKASSGVATIRPGGLGTVLLYWNYPPGSPEYRRHNGGVCSAAADGHVEWLRTPPYLGDSKTYPNYFMELGDCAQGFNPSSTWASYNPHNGTRVKLWCRYSQLGF
jgi:prepilin-type N-terminal cleavage/methylation domain-containing protein